MFTYNEKSTTLHPIMTRKVPLLTLALFSVVLGNSISVAALVLQIDTSSQTYKFAGSMPGTPSGSTIIWDTGTAGGFVNNEDVSTGLTSSSSSIDSSDFSHHTNGEISLTLNLSNNDPTTISGTGTSFSYADWNAANIMKFEDLIGSTIPLTGGTGFGPITAVPEPTAVLFFLLTVFGVAVYRWKKVGMIFFRKD